MIKYLQQYIDDPWTLRIIRKFLTSGVLDHGLFTKSEKGTPTRRAIVTTTGEHLSK